MSDQAGNNSGTQVEVHGDDKWCWVNVSQQARESAGAKVTLRAESRVMHTLSPYLTVSHALPSSSSLMVPSAPTRSPALQPVTFSFTLWKWHPAICVHRHWGAKRRKRLSLKSLSPSARRDGCDQQPNYTASALTRSE